MQISSIFIEKEGAVFIYTNKVKYRHDIGLPTACDYHNCGEKIGSNVRAIFDQYYFSLPVLHNILHHFSAWTFYHFTYLPILERYILCITNYDYDKYFSIAAWIKSGATCDAKLREKYQNN